MFFSRLRQRQKVSRLIGRLFKQPVKREAERRTEKRPTRICPILLVPEVEGKPAIAEFQFALTSDITCGGLAVITDQPIKQAMAYVGLHAEGQSHVLLASLRSAVPVGGGFRRIGLEFIQLADDGTPGIDAIRSLTAELSLRSPSKEAQDANAAREALFMELGEMGLPT